MTTTVTVEQGIKMVQFLQQMAGIDESYEDAKAGWESMGESGREITVQTYLHFNNLEESNK